MINTEMEKEVLMRQLTKLSQPHSEDIEMADPQLENGYAIIPNEIMEALSACKRIRNMTNYD